MGAQRPAQASHGIPAYRLDYLAVLPPWRKSHRRALSWKRTPKALLFYSGKSSYGRSYTPRSRQGSRSLAVLFKRRQPEPPEVEAAGLRPSAGERSSASRMQPFLPERPCAAFRSVAGFERMEEGSAEERKRLAEVGEELQSSSLKHSRRLALLQVRAWSRGRARDLSRSDHRPAASLRRKHRASSPVLFVYLTTPPTRLITASQPPPILAAVTRSDAQQRRKKRPPIVTPACSAAIQSVGYTAPVQDVTIHAGLCLSHLFRVRAPNPLYDDNPELQSVRSCYPIHL